MNHHEIDSELSLGRAAREHQEAKRKYIRSQGSSGGTGEGKCHKCTEKKDKKTDFVFRPHNRASKRYQKMFMKPQKKKSKSKHSNSSPQKEMERKVKDTTAKSDHGDKKVGFFENIKRRFGIPGPQDHHQTRSQGVMDHINQVDLLDLAADLGCISAEEQSFTFKPSSSQDQSGNQLLKSDQKRSNGLTFSDHEMDINSN